jgi:hypothetical protein
VYIRRAYTPFFTDLNYQGWDGFCSNLLTLIGTNDQTHGKLANSVGLFINTDLRHVAGIVKDHLDSSSLDGKVEVSFGSDASQRILANADEASRLLGHHVLLGLVQLSPVLATVVPSPQAPSGNKAARGGKLPAATSAARPQDPGAPRIQQRPPASGADLRPPLQVSVDGDDVTTPLYKYNMKLLNTNDRPREKRCLEFLLRSNAQLSDCPKQGTPGHWPGGECHNTNGEDPTSLPSKRRTD